MKAIGKKHASQIILVIVLGMLLLSAIVIIFPLSFIDIEFSEEVQEVHNPLLDFLMKAISWFGQMWVSAMMVSISTILLFFFKLKKEAIYCFLTLGVGLISYIVKISVNRPRPGSDLVRIIEHAKFQGFPSGHVAFYIVFFGLMAFFFYHKRWLKKPFRILIICICLGLIFAIPVSRIYLGAHWFTDVLGGFLVGCFYLTLLMYFYLNNKKSKFHEL